MRLARTSSDLSSLPRHFHLFSRALLGTLRLHAHDQLVYVLVGFHQLVEDFFKFEHGLTQIGVLKGQLFGVKAERQAQNAVLRALKAEFLQCRGFGVKVQNAFSDVDPRAA